MSSGFTVGEFLGEVTKTDMEELKKGNHCNTRLW